MGPPDPKHHIPVPAEWAVTREFWTFYKDDEAGLVSSVTNRNTRKKIVRNGIPFRMFSDVREIVCVGFCILNGGTGFEPMEQFGDEAFGATKMQYFREGRWT